MVGLDTSDFEFRLAESGCIPVSAGESGTRYRPAVPAGVCTSDGGDVARRKGAGGELSAALYLFAISDTLSGSLGISRGGGDAGAVW